MKRIEGSVVLRAELALGLVAAPRMHPLPELEPVVRGQAPRRPTAASAREVRLAGPGAGWTAWWSARQAHLGISGTSDLSASLVSLTVATLLTAAVTAPGTLRQRR